MKPSVNSKIIGKVNLKRKAIQKKKVIERQIKSKEDAQLSRILSHQKRIDIIYESVVHHKSLQEVSNTIH